MLLSLLWWIGVVTGVLLLLCHVSPPMKMFIKFGVYYVIMSVASILIIALAAVTYGNPNNFRYMKTPFGISRVLLGITPVIEGWENISSDKPFIVVSNHQSSMDFLGVAKMIPWRCTFLAKKELFYVWPFGLACWLCGIVYIDRLNHDSALTTMEETASLINKKNLVIWIFPEGRRNSSGGMLPFKRGAFHLAVKAKAPVVPVVFSAYTFYDKKKKRLDTGKYKITIMPPVPTADLTDDDVPKLSDDIRDKMLEVYEKTSW